MKKTGVVVTLILLTGLTVAACGQGRTDAEHRADEKQMRKKVLESFGLPEPHPQSPFYRGRDLENYVAFAGKLVDGKIDGVGDSWTELPAYQVIGGAPTTLKVIAAGVDPCIFDSSSTPRKMASPPMYIVVDGDDGNLCGEYYPKAAGDEKKCGALHEKIQYKALAVPGYWDDKGVYKPSATLFTLACINGVAAKCEHWGYVPWKNDYEKEDGTKIGSLLPYYTACVHAARADYKGEGCCRSS